MSREQIFGDGYDGEIMGEVGRLAFAGARVFGGEEMVGFGVTESSFQSKIAESSNILGNLNQKANI